MGFAGSSAAIDDGENVTVRVAAGWVGLVLRHGSVWQQTGTSLAIHIVR
jgi:hypothetical protein